MEGASFGGALKNTSIGVASSKGKMYIRSAGITNNTGDSDAFFKTSQDAFLESMAEAARLGIGSRDYELIDID